MIRVLVADASQRICENVARRLAHEDDLMVCGTARDGEQTIEGALRLQPDIVLVDAALPVMDGLQTTELLAQHLPEAGVIMMSMDGENESIRHAMLSGAREFLLKPFKGDELVAAVRRVHDFQQRKGSTAVEPEAVAPVEGGGAPEAPPQAPGRGALLLLMGGKGGVGRSVLAANLAVALAEASRVVLVDLCLQFGDIGALLNLDHRRTVADLALNDAVADREMVNQVLVDGPRGLKVLLAPISPELADLVTTVHVRALTNHLRAQFDYIVVVAPSYLNEVTLECVEAADRIMVVTDLSVPSVKNTRLVLQVLDVLRVQPELVMLVLNHRDTAVALERSYAESFLKRVISAEIPNDTAVVSASVGQGVPFVTANPRSPASIAVRELAVALAPELMDTEAQPSVMPPDHKKRQRRMLRFARG